MDKAIVSPSKSSKRKKSKSNDQNDERIKYALTFESLSRYTISNDDIQMLNITPNWMAITPSKGNTLCCSLEKTFDDQLQEDVKGSDVMDDEKHKVLVKGINAERRSHIHFLIEQRNTLRHLCIMMDEEIGKLMEGIDFTYDKLNYDEPRFS